MLKRKEFIAGAAAGLVIAAAATAGGAIRWPSADAQVAPALAQDARLVRTQGQVVFSPPPGAPMSFADIVEAVSPAVVSIDVRTRVDAGALRRIPGFENFPFDIPLPQGPEGPELPPQLGSGSGFFISADGYIVTNNHVVTNAEEITVRLTDDRELRARVVGTDENTDLAVLKVEGNNFPFVRFETEARPRVGDWVVAIGNPLGLGGTVTAGVVSAYGRQIDSAYVDYMQIDAPINRGNSGGPTFDIYGRVIGVNSAILSPSGYSVGIGFAIPADTAQRVTQQLIQRGRVERGYVGIQIQTFTREFRESLGLPESVSGAMVGGVTPGGPADRAGLRLHDVVTAINGEAVEGSTELTRRVGAIGVGETARLEVLRDGRALTVNVQAAARPSESELASLNADEETPPLPAGLERPAVGTDVLGMTVTPITAELREAWGLRRDAEGLLITAISPRSRAGRIFRAPGAVITHADTRPVRTVEDLRRIVDRVREAGRPGVLLTVADRTGQGGFAVLEFDAAVAESAGGR